MYKVRVVKSALKELSKLPQQESLRITRKIQKLSEEPRPSGCVKLIGSNNEYRLRVGNYRVLYTIEDSIVVVQVFKLGHRKDVYR